MITASRISTCAAVAAVLCLPLASHAQDTVTVEQPDAELRKLAAVMDLVRNRNSADYAILDPHGLDEGRYVTLGGIEQWVTIRGENRDNPVLLVLHGGPGDATNPWSYAVLRPWLRHFTVVQWDQRGAGRTLGRNDPSVASTISLERLTQDGIELAEWLRTRLNREKVILLGHSWGSILGVFMVKARPDLFHAYVGTGQVVDPARSYTVAHAELLARAERSGVSRAAAELREAGPPPYANGRGYALQRKWSNLFEGADVFLASTFALALTAPGYGPKDVNDWLEGMSVSAERLVPEASRLPAAELRGPFEVPFFVIQGADDYTTPTSLVRRYVESIRAPQKELVTLDGGHFTVFMQPDAFLAELISKVRPVAVRQ